jgi:hypothetical protein
MPVVLVQEFPTIGRLHGGRMPLVERKFAKSLFSGIALERIAFRGERAIKRFSDSWP